MAHFNIELTSSINRVFEVIPIRARKLPRYKVRKYIGKEEGDKVDLYYCSHDNKYKIKWVMMPKDGWYGSQIGALEQLPPFSRIVVIKMYK